MESPKTYRGYNQEGTCIVTNTGEDANNIINPAEVQKAIQNVETVFEEQMKEISNALMNVSSDAEDAIIVQGTNMSGTIQEVATIIVDEGTKIIQGIEPLYELAVKEHDDIQREKNSIAYNACRVSGVVNIT